MPADIGLPLLVWRNPLIDFFVKEIPFPFLVSLNQSSIPRPLSKLSNRFQFPVRVRVHCSQKEERVCHFLLGEVYFYEAAFLCGLKFHVHPFIMELLNHFKIAPRQIM